MRKNTANRTKEQFEGVVQATGCDPKQSQQESTISQFVLGKIQFLSQLAAQSET
jgi:hypothetical protein